MRFSYKKKKKKKSWNAMKRILDKKNHLGTGGVPNGVLEGPTDATNKCNYGKTEEETGKVRSPVAP